MEIKNLCNFLCAELGVELSPERDEPRLVEMFQANGFTVYEEDFFILVPGLEEPDIWEKIRRHYSPIAGRVTEKAEGSLIEVKNEEKNILIDGRYWGDKEFRVIVNVW
jgi:hypothetical protein